MSAQSSVVARSKAPLIAMWFCMLLAWGFFIAPFPDTVYVAGPLTLTAFVLALICLVQNRAGQGITGLVGTTILAPIAYSISLLATSLT